ncbi:MAG: AAA family ATPase [Campylobacterota bacterium]|nr:AAA family ATPase [Campylobacterota bacterium]
MSISNISFENYKGYPNGSLNISPITILLGANSAGKSSIIQLVLMLAQTFKQTTGNKQLILNGKYIELGESLNLIRNKSENETLSFSLDLDEAFLIGDIAVDYADYLQRSLTLSNAVK